MSWLHRMKLHRRSWSRAGWLRVCLVKWCRERRKEVESRPRIATQPNESASNGAKMWISFAVFQGKASPFFLIEFVLCITVHEIILPFIHCITVFREFIICIPLFLSLCIIFTVFPLYLQFSEESSQRQRLEFWQHHQHLCHGSWTMKRSTRLWKMMKCWTSCLWRNRRRASSCGVYCISRQGQSQSSEELSKRQRLEVLQPRKLRSFCCILKQGQSRCSGESRERQRLEILQHRKPLQSGSSIVVRFFLIEFRSLFLRCVILLWNLLPWQKKSLKPRY